jgi:regulation of enolase protein 1 (concanavalin A-like superfamily)
LTARAFDGGGLSTTSAAVSVTVNLAPTGTLPAGQTSADVGSPSPAGRTTYSSGTYTMTAGGRDIWDAADEFHFLYQAVTGNTEVIARVASVGNTNPWAKAGVMVRETLTGASRHAMMATTAGNGAWFGRRLQTSGMSSSTKDPAGTPPTWVRLVRSGDQFQAYRSPDGTNWILVGSDTIPMAATVYVGLAATSHNTASATTVSFTNVSITVPTGNAPPTVSLTSPANGATFTAPATVAIAANASDPENQLARVEFFSGTTLLGSDTSAPYSFSWSNVAAGTYSITAVAVDAAGARATSAAANVTVNTASSGAPNTVIFTASADHATNVTSYRLSVYTQGSNPATATPVATSDLGKPTPAANNDITVDRAAFFSALAPGTYVATVMAIGPGGQTQSASVTFTR